MSLLFEKTLKLSLDFEKQKTQLVESKKNNKITVLDKASWLRMQNQNLRPPVPTLLLARCVISGQLPLCASVSISINRDC